MKAKFNILTSTCVPLPLENVDTDQIIPARFLKATTKHLFFQNVGELGLHMAYIYSRATGLNYEGPALGVNFRCCLPDTSLGNKILNGLNLMAEYDARTINIGFNYAVWKDRFNLIAELNDGKYLSAGLYFKICLK